MVWLLMLYVREQHMGWSQFIEPLMLCVCDVCDLCFVFVSGFWWRSGEGTQVYRTLCMRKSDGMGCV